MPPGLWAGVHTNVNRLVLKGLTKPFGEGMEAQMAPGAGSAAYMGSSVGTDLRLFLAGMGTVHVWYVILN